MVEESFDSALNVQAGIEPPVSVNPYLKNRPRPTKKELTVDEYVSGILAGDRVILSRAITLVESVNPTHFEKAQQIIEKCLPHSGKSVRIGITGVPGVGKSTFIESFGKMLTAQGKRVAVLAIDPSSERSKGSILGDKTRMEELSTDANAFIRPSPSGLTLGGVARKTRETSLLCEAAGFDVIIIETVGVGQSETVVKSMVDFFLLLMIAGAGDELQGIKRGIMEMADAIVITKADGDNISRAELAKTQYRSALHLFPKNENGWEIPVATCSALEKKNLETVWSFIENFVRQTQANGWFQSNRNEQSIKIFYEWIENTLRQNFFATPEVKALVESLLPNIRNGVLSPYQAAAKVLSYQK
ncbi:MAG: methylmalonyl Co-A mutase-associated GTPase MeaB [Bacteroidales bacterium]|nr:methylmalonyl Co-A mutase-associated GTPase MeaB [Bacteroidales bacterium]